MVIALSLPIHIYQMNKCHFHFSRALSLMFVRLFEPRTPSGLAAGGSPIRSSTALPSSAAGSWPTRGGPW